MTIKNLYTYIPKSTLWAQKNKKRYNRYKQVYNAKAKLKVLRHYGGNIPRCQKCGICDVRFLVLDHIENGGEVQRKQVGRGSHFYTWLIKNNFPTKLRVLCYHCNHVVRRN